MTYRPNLGDETKELTEKFQALLKELGRDGTEGEAAAEAVKFSLLLVSLSIPQANCMSWEEMQEKILVKVLS